MNAIDATIGTHVCWKVDNSEIPSWEWRDGEYAGTICSDRYPGDHGAQVVDVRCPDGSVLAGVALTAIELSPDEISMRGIVVNN